MFSVVFRTFVNTFIQFKKPIIAAVNGPAIGLGASILPLCDVIWANEKAWFQTPYTIFGQTPDACSSVTFPLIMGVASVSTSIVWVLMKDLKDSFNSLYMSVCVCLLTIVANSDGVDVCV